MHTLIPYRLCFLIIYLSIISLLSSEVFISYNWGVPTCPKVCVYVCMCVCVYMCTCVCVYMCTCVHVYMCTCLYNLTCYCLLSTTYYLLPTVYCLLSTVYYLPPPPSPPPPLPQCTSSYFDCSVLSRYTGLCSSCEVRHMGIWHADSV
jgi:hypothetical protein